MAERNSKVISFCFLNGLLCSNPVLKNCLFLLKSIPWFLVDFYNEHLLQLIAEMWGSRKIDLASLQVTLAMPTTVMVEVDLQIPFLIEFVSELAEMGFGNKLSISTVLATAILVKRLNMIRLIVRRLKVIKKTHESSMLVQLNLGF